MDTDKMVDPRMNDVASCWSAPTASAASSPSPSATSWNLGVPQNADKAVRDEPVDLVFLSRPALATPHWPVWAARELARPRLSLVQEDWRWWLENFRGHAPIIGWPKVRAA